MVYPNKNIEFMVTATARLPGWIVYYVGVSKNRGTLLKWMVYNGKPY